MENIIKKYSFYASITDSRIITTTLKAINFETQVIGFVSSRGIKFTVEKSKSMKINAFIVKDIFQEFHLLSDDVTFLMSHQVLEKTDQKQHLQPLTVNVFINLSACRLVWLDGWTCQRAMDNLLGDLKDVTLYLDDIIIASVNHIDHMKTLGQVFERLEKAGITLQPEKYKMGKRKIKILGYLINEKGMLPDPEKIESILKIKPPKNKRQLRSFLGMCNYHRVFIVDYASLTAPLNNLLKLLKIIWNEKFDQYMEKLKTALTNAPIMSFPNTQEPYILETDASHQGMGATLRQGNHIIAYSNKTSNTTQVRYSTVDKELLAIVWAINQFIYYLYGRHFTVITDHNPLVHIRQSKNPTNRQFRWIEGLEQFDFTINYRPGHLNDTADILSRPEFTNAIVQNADVFNWKHGQSKDTDCIEAVKILSLNKKLPESNKYYKYENKLKAENGLLYYSRPNKLLLVIAMSDRLNIINHYHRFNFYCHAG
ncbi:hypothetical protein A3Q56_06729, partial [Intoshia linei]